VQNDFITSGFSISQYDNFESKALHSTHFYPSAMVEPGSIELTAELKYPILLRDEGAYMSFDEVVLVEPSEIHTVFGQHGFWDYVIVEGSLDRESWYAFEKNGYDSAEDELWLKRYYSNIVSENKSSSRALGDESLYVHKVINLLANKYLRRGDIVYVRFRLFSDPFTNAWGWAIDNLNIQDPSLVVSLDESMNDIIFYPNPFENELHISRKFSFYTISNLFGDVVGKGRVDGDMLNFNIPKGIYIIELKGETMNIIRKIVKQ